MYAQNMASDGSDICQQKDQTPASHMQSTPERQTNKQEMHDMNNHLTAAKMLHAIQDRALHISERYLNSANSKCSLA